MSKAQFLKDNLKPGEFYAGLILGEKGEPDYHLFGLPVELDGVVWQQAMKHGESIGAVLPNRREARLAWVNAKQHFKTEAYWTSEQHVSDSDGAYCQYFDNGYQDYDGTGNELRARFFRRSAI